MSKVAQQPQRIEMVPLNPFLLGPKQYLVRQLTAQLRLVPEFVQIFDVFIDGYMRMDYDVRNLPAMRIYSAPYRKEADSGWMSGQVKLDLIWPANIRRTELQDIPDVIEAALVQQFREQAFFDLMNTLVPGLNQLGTTMEINPELAFEWQDQLLPLTQISINFRLDLREWDVYLESQGRTKDDPFNVTLGDLKKIATTIQAMRETDPNDPSVQTVELQLTMQDTAGG